MEGVFKRIEDECCSERERSIWRENADCQLYLQWIKGMEAYARVRMVSVGTELTFSVLQAIAPTGISP